MRVTCRAHVGFNSEHVIVCELYRTAFRECRSEETSFADNPLVSEPTDSRRQIAPCVLGAADCLFDVS